MIDPEDLANDVWDNCARIKELEDRVEELGTYATTLHEKLIELTHILIEESEGK